MVMTAPPPGDAPALPPPPPPDGYTDLMLLTCGGLEDVTCDLIESRLGVNRDGGEFVLEVAAYAALLADGAGASREAPALAPAGFRGGEAAVGKCVLRLNDASRGFDSGRKGVAERSLSELVAELEASCGVQTVVALVCFEQSCFDDAPGDKAAALAELTNGIQLVISTNNPTTPPTSHQPPHRPPPPKCQYLLPQRWRRVDGSCGRRRRSGSDGARRRRRLASCGSALRACATVTMRSKVRTRCARWAKGYS